MIYPLNLEKGYKIGVTAPSAGCETQIDLNGLENGIKNFNQLGYQVTVTDHVRNCMERKSADGPTRAKELMQLFCDKEIRVIVAAQGGDYLVEMLPYLDFEVIKRNPKWMQGYSDPTGLTFTITTNLDIATIYSDNFSSFGMEHWYKSIINNVKILEGQDIVQNSFEKYQGNRHDKVTGIEDYVFDTEVQWKNLFPANQDEIVLQGRAIGGCLDVLLNLVGTKFDKTKEFIDKYQKDGILWYLESYDLGSEDLFRGLWQLKEAGWFEHAVGFLFGRPMFYSDAFASYGEVVLSALGELNLPVILDADIGHKPPQLAMINGAVATVESRGGKGKIIFERR